MRPTGSSGDPITLSLVEDDQNTRRTLAAMLQDEPRVRCLATYPTAEAALRGIPLEKPEVALIDINLPGKSGIDCARELLVAAPGIRILMLTTYNDSDLIFESLRAGARGYILKKSMPQELIGAIEQVHAGGAPMSMQVASKVVEFFHQTHAPEVESLTAREQEILALLAKGQLYKQIADQLGISIGTVRTHLQSIYGKLHVRSRTEATLKFLRRP
jgi:DNA-binding NarL/FixJ family response regulator